MQRCVFTLSGKQAVGANAPTVVIGHGRPSELTKDIPRHHQLQGRNEGPCCSTSTHRQGIIDAVRCSH